MFVHTQDRAAVNVAMSLELAELVANTTGVRPLVMPYAWVWPTPTGGLNPANPLNGTYGNKPARGLDLVRGLPPAH